MKVFLIGAWCVIIFLSASITLDRLKIFDLDERISKIEMQHSKKETD
jgi:hypothetical protein